MHKTLAAAIAAVTMIVVPVAATSPAWGDQAPGLRGYEGQPGNQGGGGGGAPGLLGYEGQPGHQGG